MKTGAERRPPPGIQAQHPAPAPHASHARHDRSMARNRLAARAKVVDNHFSPSVFTKVRPEATQAISLENVDFSKQN